LRSATGYGGEINSPTAVRMAMLLFIIAISQLSITFVDVAAAKNDLKGTIHNLNSKYHPGIVFP
jgi:hypothetical protein